jgi:hypothetical protein|tara:strand:- start:1282 stop:1908 length:627 start_codon:yes stop_codon:yes gene_type:complete
MTGIISQNVGRPSGLIKATAGAGAWILIKSQTASSSSTIDFVDGTSDVVLDSTFPIYVFKFINIHPGGDGHSLEFNMSADSGSNYNVTKTSTAFNAYHLEGDSDSGLGYNGSSDLAQSTNFQRFMYNIGNGNDETGSGTLTLFNPSSTTFVKHFIGTNTSYQSNDYSTNNFIAGYCNTTSAIDAIRFQMQSGNIDSGTIKLYGIKDSE